MLVVEDLVLKKKSKNRGRLFIISAPSGAGKTTIANAVIGKLGDDYPISKVITYTSRSPRDNEVQGRDYCFISKEDFSEKKKKGFFLETTEYNGQWYGSPQFILDDLVDGKLFIIITDIKGTKSLVEKIGDAVLIWLAPPSHETLRKRLVKRGTESSEGIEKRVMLSKKEMEQEKKESFFHHRVINDSFELAANELCQIIKEEIEQAQRG